MLLKIIRTIEGATSKMSNSHNNTVYSGMGMVGWLAVLLTCIFVAAKLWDKIDWSWLWVFSPIMIAISIPIAIILIVFVIAVIGFLVWGIIMLILLILGKNNSKPRPNFNRKVFSRTRR